MEQQYSDPYLEIIDVEETQKQKPPETSSESHVSGWCLKAVATWTQFSVRVYDNDFTVDGTGVLPIGFTWSLVSYGLYNIIM